MDSSTGVRSIAGVVPTRTPPAAAQRRRGDTIRFLLSCWLTLSVAGVAWGFATPLFAGPDEPFHVVRAVALMQGQVVGEVVPQEEGSYFDILQEVEVPAYYGTAHVIPQCYAFDSAVSASCSPAFQADDRSLAEVDTSFGLYPPLYYAMVGAPTLVFDGATAVHGMRALNAVLTAGFLSIGMTALWGSRMPRAALAAGAVAVTPMALFLAGVVNPSAMETAAGFATWAVLLPLVLDPDSHNIRRRLLAGASLAAVLVNVRPSSGLIAALILLSLLTLSSRSFLRAALISPSTWAPSAVVAAAGVGSALAWILIYDPTSAVGGFTAPHLADPLAALAAGMHESRAYLEQQIGVFGWLDTPAPLLTLLIWVGALGALVVGALAFTDRRGHLALWTCIVLVVLVPVVSMLPTIVDLGLVWQGRYLLPYSLGLPLLACALLLRSPSGRRFGQALIPVVVPLVLVGHIAAFAWNLWRYAYGLDKTPLVDDAEWLPPGGAFVLPTIAIGAVLALGALILRAPLLRVPGSTAALPSSSERSSSISHDGDEIDRRPPATAPGHERVTVNA